MTPRRAATSLPHIYQAYDKTYEMRDIVLDILLMCKFRSMMYAYFEASLRPEPSRTTIDLAWAGTEADGTPVYAPPLEAAMRQVGQRLGWLLVKYPHGTTHGLALSTVGAACAYFIYAAI